MQIREAIKWYVNFYFTISSDSIWKLTLKAALPAFEQTLLQNSKRYSLFKFIKFITGTCIYEPKTQNFFGNPQTIYFWPFQFLHCDVLRSTILSLKKKKQPVEVIVTRVDLIPYLKNLGIEAQLFIYKRQVVSFRKFFFKAYGLCKILFALFISRQQFCYKKHLLMAMEYASMVSFFKVILNQVVIPDSRQYHVVGYDMSLMGRVIIEETNRNNVRNGRIQNGAPNYFIAGYSEVQEIFFWESISLDAYRKLGYQGRSVITGNPLLYEKIKSSANPDWNFWIERHAVNYSGRVFVALSGPGHNTTIEGHNQTIKLLELIVKQASNFVFLIKLHTKDHNNYYKSLHDHKRVIFTDRIVPKQAIPDALDILLVSDILVTGASTVALDALRLNKYVISIDPLRELGHFGFLKNGVTQINNLQDLSSAMEDLNHIKKNGMNKEQNYDALFNGEPSELITKQIINR